MSKKVMDWMIWVVDIVSDSLYNGDKTVGYDMLKKYGIFDWYVEHYEVTHSLGKEYLLNEVQEIIKKGGIAKC